MRIRRSAGSPADSPESGAGKSRPSAGGPFATQQRIFRSRDGGPVGTKVNISGDGFAPNDVVVFTLHTIEVGRTTAASDGSFSGVQVEIPNVAGSKSMQLSMTARGLSSPVWATAPFMVSR